ncbi:MAG TPA: alpha/beta hydrolase-fold protein [Terriglobia bacterium]|nr:alpha/beta hydrolase-fold protein [Terriglobia bacterium]
MFRTITFSVVLVLSVVAPKAPAATPQAAPTQIVCGSVPSKILGEPVDYCADLPADYNSSRRRYPTLYFLHGLFENYHAWDENGGKDVLDGLLKQGKIGPFIVILPDGDNTFYVNSYDGQVRYEDFFVQELIPFVDRRYRTIRDRRARGISGVSMGGYGALHLAMRHPDIFGSVSAQSAALIPKFPNPLPTTGRWGFYARVLEKPFGNPLNETYFDENNPLTLAEHPERFRGLKIYFDVGIDDRYGFEKGAELLNQILDEHKFPHTFVLRQGNHGWSYEQKYLQYSLIFHWRVFHAYEVAAGSGAQAP